MKEYKDYLFHIKGSIRESLIGIDFRISVYSDCFSAYREEDFERL